MIIFITPERQKIIDWFQVGQTIAFHKRAMGKDQLHNFDKLKGLQVVTAVDLSQDFIILEFASKEVFQRLKDGSRANYLVNERRVRQEDTIPIVLGPQHDYESADPRFVSALSLTYTSVTGRLVDDDFGDKNPVAQITRSELIVKSAFEGETGTLRFDVLATGKKLDGSSETFVLDHASYSLSRTPTPRGPGG